MFFARIVDSGPVAELFRTPRPPYTRALLATLDHATPGPASSQRGLVDQERPGCIYQTQCPRRLPRCAEAHPPTAIVGPGHGLACYNPG